ncbi:sun protein [Acidithiobacillus ferrivorans SS3]|uniref:16S rRNA (cytosine(967)-C(5))-methyltransferase n=2 Tax=Acidithiobacillus ferrivorans TaxID=160808 RepID=G0JPM5_9PROT|nr:sun protein [Acidithiobacillus ferrivorans SS3]
MKETRPETERGRSTAGVAMRKAAIGVLQGVDSGQTVDAALLPVSLTGADRATVQWLVLGTLREYLPVQALAAKLLRKDWREEDTDLRFLLSLALFELRHGQRPAFAVVNDWVAMTEALKKPWARGLVNAVLRRYLREREALDVALVDRDLGHPAWLAARLRAAYPQDWPAIAAANNTTPPLWLRVNTQRVDPGNYRQLLAEQGLEAKGVAWSAAALCLPASVPVATLPGWDAGWVAVQDGAAQMAAHILAPQEGERILDACAAPGGKTAHLWALGATRLDALDRSAERLKRVREALERQGGTVHLQAADAAETATWWNGEFYDAILLDAPCTGTGVIRRHPDIRLRRQMDDVTAAVAQQVRLLEGLWPCLRPGGRLLYATCSVLPEENEEQIIAFLLRHADAHRSAHPLTGQRLPGQDAMDGFYYALLEKAT